MTETLFVEKYRPRTIADTILPEGLKKAFQSYVDSKNIPNLILSGPPGCGKTTVARAMLEELGCDYIIINSSMKGNIDTLRNEIMNFASSVSFSGGKKYVILDEADGLNASSTQPALRAFIEDFSSNCGFIMTCNYKNRLIEPLHSRCSVIDFKISPDEKTALSAQFFKRLVEILDKEGIEYEQKSLVALIKKFFPDWRRVLNNIQRYSVNGKIDVGILSDITEETFNGLIKLLKEKNFTEIRKWVSDNSDIETETLYRKLYDTATTHLTKPSIPQLVLILAKYQYQAAFVADHELNNVACLLEVMLDCEFN